MSPGSYSGLQCKNWGMRTWWWGYYLLDFVHLLLISTYFFQALYILGCVAGARGNHCMAWYGSVRDATTISFVHTATWMAGTAWSTTLWESVNKTHQRPKSLQGKLLDLHVYEYHSQWLLVTLFHNLLCFHLEFCLESTVAKFSRQSDVGPGAKLWSLKDHILYRESSG